MPTEPAIDEVIDDVDTGVAHDVVEFAEGRARRGDQFGTNIRSRDITVDSPYPVRRTELRDCGGRIVRIQTVDDHRGARSKEVPRDRHTDAAA